MGVMNNRSGRERERERQGGGRKQRVTRGHISEEKTESERGDLRGRMHRLSVWEGEVDAGGRRQAYG